MGMYLLNSKDKEEILKSCKVSVEKVINKNGIITGYIVKQGDIIIETINISTEKVEE